MSKENLSAKIKEAIRLSELMKKDIADSCGVTTETLRNWEKGKQLPDALQIKKIADITQNNLAWFYGEDVSLSVSEPRASYGSSREIGRLEGKVETLQEELNWYKTEIRDLLSKCSEGFKNKAAGSLANNRKGG